MIRKFNGKKPIIAPSAFISEAAYVVGDVEIGEMSNIWPGAVIRADFGKITIGKNTSIEDNCLIHGPGDATIGDNVIIGHGAVIHCKRIGNYVLIGNNATILDEVEIADSCIIGAGSLLKIGTKIPANSLVVGSPAVVKRKLSHRQLNMLKDDSDIYTKLAEKYKLQGL